MVALNDPPLAGARQLPELRMELLDRWREGGPYYNAAVRLSMARRRLGHPGTGSAGKDAVLTQPPGPRAADPPQTVPLSPSFDRTALSRASLWYVTPDMAELVDHSARTLPPTTLHDDLVPGGWGLVFFARPLTGHDADTGAEINTWGLLWGVTRLRDLEEGDAFIESGPTYVEIPKDERVLTISCYGRTAEHFAIDGHSPRSHWYPQGRSDWRWGADTDAPTFEGFDEVHRSSMLEERRWLAALWLLAAQPLASTEEVHAPRAARRRIGRAGGRLAPLGESPVRLIDVRGSRVPREPGDRSEATGREYTRRWVVTGHWRQQAYGPGWSLRRPTYIADHIAGPDDRPLVVREDVHVVRGSPAGTNRAT